MSLDTILHIGNVLKLGSKDPMQHYRHTKRPQAEGDIIYMSIDVRKVDGKWILDWNSIREISENQRDQLYYLSCKTSEKDNDGGSKYIYGDIYFSKQGNYKIDKGDSFDNSKKDIELYVRNLLKKTNISKSKNDVVEYCVSGKEFEGNINEEILKDDIISFWHLFSCNKNELLRYLKCAPVLFTRNKQFDIEYQYLTFLLNNNKKQVAGLLEKEWKDLEDYERCEMCGGESENELDDEKKKQLLQKYNKKKLSSISKPEDLKDYEKNKLLDYVNHSVFIHFNFVGLPKSNWHEQPEFEKIVDILNNKISEKDGQGNIVVSKYIYPTLCSGDKKNDIQFPNFQKQNSYKSFFFTEDSFNDLLYANEICSCHRMWIKGSNIKIYVFPRSFNQDIDAETYEDFFFKRKSEASLLSFDFLNSFESYTSCCSICFDFVFCEKGQTDKYLLELSGLENSKLHAIKNCINKSESDIKNLMIDDLGWADKFLNVENAFLSLLGFCRFKDGKCDFEMSKFCESHLLKVLPQIYTDSYYSDNSLLHYLNNQVESICRNITECRNTYNKLKYAFMLLCKIQKHNKYIEIMSSQSFELGKILGRLAQPLGRKISSFQKNYVGLLNRRVATKDDCRKFANEINGKLVMHDCLYCRDDEISAFIKGIETILNYNKDEFAFGFFDGYFKYDSNYTESLFVTRVEKLLSDYKDNEKTPNEFKGYMSEMSELLDKMKTTIK